MKVRLEKETKKCITLEEAPIVRQVIASVKEDESTVEDYAKIAIDAACDFKAYGVEIMKASAVIAKNGRLWNGYGDDSRDIDIWIEATAYINQNEFIIIGAYFSDIWQITSDNTEEITSHMYIRRFKEVKETPVTGSWV